MCAELTLFIVRPTSIIEVYYFQGHLSTISDLTLSKIKSELSLVIGLRKYLSGENMYSNTNDYDLDLSSDTVTIISHL